MERTMDEEVFLLMDRTNLSYEAAMECVRKQRAAKGEDLVPERRTADLGSAMVEALHVGPEDVLVLTLAPNDAPPNVQAQTMADIQRGWGRWMREQAAPCRGVIVLSHGTTLEAVPVARLRALLDPQADPCMETACGTCRGPDGDPACPWSEKKEP